jgi:DNA (cytosine-5)-methyltransferase 1
MRRSPRLAKMERIAQGGPIRVLDLFAGCGGFSLGFASASFKILGAIELDPLAARSHALNFCKGHDESVILRHSLARDITTTEPEEAVAAFSSDPTLAAVDVLIGGPPCQAFARVGRAKLREIASHPKAFLKDERSNLYLRFLHYIKRLQPLAIVLENVPDALNYGGHNIAEEMCEALDDVGYVARYTLLNSVFYGVPQMRERMFLIAYTKELGAEVTFPEPSHWISLPRGYEGSRSVALKNVGPDLFNDCFYVPRPVATRGVLPAVTAKDALKDLPRITHHLNGSMTRGARRFDVLTPYPTKTDIGDYSRLMRDWPGFESRGGVFDHVTRSLPRDYRIFARMNPGDQYPEAFKHAEMLFRQRLTELRSNGSEVLPGTASYKRLRAEFVPPYDPLKFPNKWRKMEADLPARTLMAHLGKDSYSHIHYDSEQARTISVREAARLQSFPDGFVFAGTMNPAFRQIGNAVPPLLAKALAGTVLNTLRRKDSNEEVRIKAAYSF